MSEKLPLKTPTSSKKATSIPRPSSSRITPRRYPTIPPIKPLGSENNTDTNKQQIATNRPRSAIPTPVKSNSTKLVPSPPSAPKPSKATSSRRVLPAGQNTHVQPRGIPGLRPLAVVGKNVRKAVQSVESENQERTEEKERRVLKSKIPRPLKSYKSDIVPNNTPHIDSTSILVSEPLKPIETVVISKKCASKTAIFTEEKSADTSPEPADCSTGKVDISEPRNTLSPTTKLKPYRPRLDKLESSKTDKVQRALQERTIKELPQRKCGELIDEISMANAVKELKNAYEMMIRMNRKYCTRKEHDTPILQDPFPGSTIVSLKRLANGLCKEVTDLHSNVATVQESAQELVIHHQDMLTKTKQKLNKDVSLRQQTIKKLQQDRLDLELKIKEKDSNFESLQALADNMNAENDKLDTRCRQLEGDNVKATLELSYRSRELNNLRCDADSKEKNLLNEYDDIVKERNNLNLQLALMQSDLSMTESRRLIVSTENNQLREQIDVLTAQIKELGGKTPELKPPIKQDDDACLDETTGENPLKAVRSLMNIHKADLPYTSSLADTSSLGDTSSHEQKVFLTEGEMQNGLVQQTIDGSLLAMPQKVADQLMKLELSVQERDIKITELQETISSLEEMNASLEKEQKDDMMKYEGFRQETLEEAQRLRDIHDRLKDKEQQLDEKLNKDQSKEASTNDGTDWFDECIKATKRVKDLQDLLNRQDDMFKEMESERKSLREEIKSLKRSSGKPEDTDSIQLQGVQEMLQEMKNVMTRLSKKDGLSRNCPKPVRFYQDKDQAIKELETMKKSKTTAVFIVTDAFSTSSKEFAYRKVSKRRERKARQKSKIQKLIEENENTHSCTVKDATNIPTSPPAQNGKREMACVQKHSLNLISEERSESSKEEQTRPEQDETAAKGQAYESLSSDLDLEMWLSAREEWKFGVIGYNPVISKSIKDMQRQEVDKLRSTLETGRAVNTLTYKPCKHSSMLMYHRQTLSPLSEPDDAQGYDEAE